MTLLSSLRRLWREECGVTAAAMALFITSLAGITAAAVDMGVVFTAKAQLQSAADASALAAADTMLSVGANKQAVAQPSSALAAAIQFSSANQALGIAAALKNPPGNDFTIGYWDQGARAFDAQRTGLGLTDPNDLTAVQVRVRRDAQANSPVSTYFARILGIDQVQVSAVSTAFLGFPATVPPGSVQLPLAVLDTNMACLPCDSALKLDDIAAWTSFSTYPNNSTTVNYYLNGHSTIPDLKVGDAVYLNGDEVSNSYFDNVYSNMQSLYNSRGVDTNHDHKADYWVVVLPVVRSAVHARNQGQSWPERFLAQAWQLITPVPAFACGPTTSHEVAGFVTLKLTKLNNSDHSKASGAMQCEQIITGSSTGGGNFGSRASTAKLVR
jgi:Flp pilus assembly protein TadG